MHACTQGPAGQQEEGQGPNQASKGGRNGEFWQVLGWAGLASRDNFGAMFQVPEDKAHLRRESNSRHVSESGPHAPGPMYLQGFHNASEVPRGPCQCTSSRTAYFVVRCAQYRTHSCPGLLGSEHGGDPLCPGAVLRCRQCTSLATRYLPSVKRQAGRAAATVLRRAHTHSLTHKKERYTPG